MLTLLPTRYRIRRALPMIERKARYAPRLFAITGLMSLGLLLAGEWHAVGALWIVVVCLLPGVVTAFKTDYLSVRIFCGTTLVTQIITLPIFYINADRYNYGWYRPFGFTAGEVAPIYVIIGLFLWMLALLTTWVQRVLGRPLRWQNTDRGVGALRMFAKAERPAPYLAGLVFLMMVTLPVKLWMFDMGIGLVGVSPPKLPYRLSGILFYATAYVGPIAMGYFYSKTRRSSLLLVLGIGLYALIFAVCTTSKGVALLISTPVIVFAWKDKQWLILVVAVALAGFAVMTATASRDIVHISDGFTTIAYTGLGPMGTLFETLSRVEWSAENLMVFSDIAGRIEAFQGLWLASQFNPDAVGGPWLLFLKTLYGSWADLGHDAMHLEYLGHKIPEGFYNIVATVNGIMMMASNHQYYMLAPFAIFTTFVLLTQEYMLMQAAYHYRLSQPVAQIMLLIVTLWFYTGPGTGESTLLLAATVFFGWHSKNRARRHPRRKFPSHEAPLPKLGGGR